MASLRYRYQLRKEDVKARVSRSGGEVPSSSAGGMPKVEPTRSYVGEYIDNIVSVGFRSRKFPSRESSSERSTVSRSIGSNGGPIKSSKVRELSRSADCDSSMTIWPGWLLPKGSDEDAGGRHMEVQSSRLCSVS